MDSTRSPFIWLPGNPPAENGGQEAASPFIFVMGGWEDLFGEPATWDGLLERLHRYALREVLDVGSRLSASLRSAGTRSTDFQVQVCMGLFGDRGREILEAAQELDGRLDGPGSRVVLFTEIALVNLTKVAFLELDAHEGGEEDDLSGLGEALLMISGLAEPHLPGMEGPEDTPRAVLEHYALANALFNHEPNWVHAMARAFELYFSDQPHLADNPHYCDLPERVERLTGLDPQAAWNALFALAGHWAGITPERVAERSGFIDRESYLTANLEISHEESERLFELVSTPVGEVVQLVRSRYSLDDLRWFDVLPLAANPLVEIEGKVFAPSAPLLFGRLFDGLHHMHLDRSEFSNDERERYLSYMGAVFEDYVERSLVRTYPPTSGRFIGGRELAQEAERKVADGLILYGDGAVVVEVKAVRLTAEVRSGSDAEGYEAKIQELFLDALQQIYDTVRQIQEGVIGLPIEVGALQFFPVIVSLEPFPIWPLVYDGITERAREREILAPPGTAPWQLINVGELEFIETAVEQGLSLLDFLRAKVDHTPGVGLSVTNFVYVNPDLFVEVGRNAYLAEVFDKLATSAVEWVRRHAREV